MISSQKINDKIKELGGRAWEPLEVAQVNDQVIRLALMKGEYRWHKHEDEDEFFYVIKGKLTIQVENQPNIELNENEIAVIPKGVMHCPKSADDTYVLMFEPYALQSKGN